MEKASPTKNLQEEKKDSSSKEIQTKDQNIPNFDQRRKNYKEDKEKAQKIERSRSRSQSKNNRENEKRSEESEDEHKNNPDLVIKGRGFQQRRNFRSSLRGWDEEEESFNEANSKLKEYFLNIKIVLILNISSRIDFQIKKSRKKLNVKDGFQSRGWLEKPNDRQRKILEELHFKRSVKHVDEDEKNGHHHGKTQEKFSNNVNFFE